MFLAIYNSPAIPCNESLFPAESWTGLCVLWPRNGQNGEHAPRGVHKVMYYGEEENLNLYFNQRKGEIVSICDIQIDAGALIDLCIRWSSVTFLSEVSCWKVERIDCDVFVGVFIYM